MADPKSTDAKSNYEWLSLSVEAEHIQRMDALRDRLGEREPLRRVSRSEIARRVIAAGLTTIEAELCESAPAEAVAV